MRLPRPRRALALLALAVAAITCTDAPTAPSASRAVTSARIGLAPRFSATAERAYAGLTRLGFAITSVRVRLTAASGDVPVDTVVSFPTTQDTLVLDLPVQIEGSEETFTALIELRDATGLRLFSATRLVTARVGSLPGALPAAFAMEYTGPGRDARALTLSPAGGLASATEAVALTAIGLDSAARPLSDLLVDWSTSDSSLAIVARTGDASAELHGSGRRGSVTISASTPTGLSASTTLALVPPATRLVVVGGADQTGVAGRALALPFVVELQASDGGPVPNQRVQFRALGAGSVGTASTVTDAAGRASTAITPGVTAGAYSFEATSGSVAAVRVSSTATAAPPSAIAIVSGDGQNATIGDLLGNPLVVVVTDEFGGTVSGARVRWSRVTGSGSPDVAQSVTDSAGRASLAYRLGPDAGSEVVRASLPDARDTSVVFRVTASPGDPSTFSLIQTLPATLPVGAVPANAIRVQLADIGGNAVAAPGITVTATGVLASSGTQAFSLTATSDAAGIVSFAVPAYVGTVGTVVVAITAPGFTTLELPAITFVTGTVAWLRVKTQPSSVASSGAPLAVQPVVKLYDVGWNDVRKSGVSVTAYVASGGGVLSGTTVAVTDVSGTATFTDLAITGSGTQVLGFSSGTVPDVASGPIALSAAPSALETVAGWLAPTTAVNGTTLATFKVRLVDATGQPVSRAGVPITVAATALVGMTPAAPLVGSLTSVTDATGVAVFDDVGVSAPLGDYTLTVTADPTVVALPSLTLVSALTVTN